MYVFDNDNPDLFYVFRLLRRSSVRMLIMLFLIDLKLNWNTLRMQGLQYPLEVVLLYLHQVPSNRAKSRFD